MFGSTDAVFFPTFLLHLRLVLCRPEGTFFMAQRKYPGNNRYHTLFIESLPAIMAIETLGGVQPLQKRAREHRHRHHGGMPPRYLRKLAVMLSPLGWRKVHTAICRRPQNPVRRIASLNLQPSPMSCAGAFHASDLHPTTPNKPPDQALLKGLSPQESAEIIQSIKHPPTLFNLSHFFKGCDPRFSFG